MGHFVTTLSWVQNLGSKDWKQAALCRHHLIPSSPLPALKQNKVCFQFQREQWTVISTEGSRTEEGQVYKEVCIAVACRVPIGAKRKNESVPLSKLGPSSRIVTHSYKDQMQWPPSPCIVCDVWMLLHLYLKCYQKTLPVIHHWLRVHWEVYTGNIIRFFSELAERLNAYQTRVTMLSGPVRAKELKMRYSTDEFKAHFLHI